MARPIWNSNPILSEEERMKQRLIQAQIQRRQQLQKARSGSLLRQQGTYEAAPKATSSWDNLFTPNEGARPKSTVLEFCNRNRFFII